MVLKTEYIRKINKSNLIITPEKDWEAEKDSITMFQYNQIPCFLNMKAQKKNITLQFWYDITGRRSLDQLLEYKSLDYEMLYRILSSFDLACVQAEDFMMTENDILLNPEFVFADGTVEQMSYCYLPGNREDICGQFRAFMEYLLKNLNHKDEQAVQFAYEIYQRVVEERTDLHSVLREAVYLADKERQKPADPSIEQHQLEYNHTEQYQTSLQQNDAQQYWPEYRETEEKAEQSLSEQKYKQNPAAEPDLSVKNTAVHVWKQPDQLPAEDDAFFSSQVKQQKHENRRKNKQARTMESADRTEQKQEAEQLQKEDSMTRIRQKETLRKQAVQKLKKMLCKKIYTDHSRYAEEDTVFEADAEEELACSHPTVCLVPETDGIQNRFVYQGADRSRDFQCMQERMILGSDMQESDIYIPLPMVSRVHARVLIEAQGTFLEDMNSTNGTHVNGELLQYRERRLLQKGDIVSLAGESYSFH